MKLGLLLILFFFSFSHTSIAQIDDLLVRDSTCWYSDYKNGDSVASLFTDSIYYGKDISIYLSMYSHVFEDEGIFEYEIIPHYGTQSRSSVYNKLERKEGIVKINIESKKIYFYDNLGKIIKEFKIDSLSNNKIVLKDSISNRSFSLENDLYRFYDPYINFKFVQKLSKKITKGQIILFLSCEEEDIKIDIVNTNLDKLKVDQLVKTIKKHISNTEREFIKKKGKLFLIYPNNNIRNIY